MFTTLMNKMGWPYWATPRYKKLVALTKMVDGTFYDHLPHDFYTEEDHAGNYIPLVERRPSAQSMMAFEVVSGLSRKLFAGRHVPRVTHDNPAFLQWAMKIIATSALYEKFQQAMLWGSVGSVAMTFTLIDGELRVNVWRPYQCVPTFDRMGDLSALRVQYVTKGSVLVRSGFTHDCKGDVLDPTLNYWFIKEWTADEEHTFYPLPEAEYSPTGEDEYMLVVVPEKVFAHGLGMVPAIWIRNLPGGEGIDGISTFGIAANNIIEIDYTMSQLGRGIRYSAAPQLVIIGDMDESDGMNYRRGPVGVLKLKSSYGDETQKLGGSDAKLLEMVGNGTQVGLNYVDTLRKATLNAISASARTAQTHTGALSGRSMELMDDSFYDLVNAMRSTYGDGGFVPFLSKIVAAYARTGSLPPEIAGMQEEELTSFGIRWPKVFTSTPQDEMSMVESLTMATQNGLLDIEVAKEYLFAQMDLEDYRVESPPQTGSDAVPTAPKEGTVPDDNSEQYNEGINPDERRPGPQGHTLPRRDVNQGARKITI